MSGKYVAVGGNQKRRSKNPEKDRRLSNAAPNMKKEQIYYQNFDSKAKDETFHQDLTSYWCSKCQTFFKNFKLLQDHRKKEHSQSNVAAKRSVSKGTFYQNPSL